MNAFADQEQIEIAWASTPKWATFGTSDSIDVVDRGDGSQVLIMIDVQGSGPTGNRLARNLMSFARELTASGSDPLVVAAASNQYLVAQRGGGVSATIHIVVTVAPSSELSIAGYGPCQVASQSVAGWLITEFTCEVAGNAFETQPGQLSLTSITGLPIVIANDGAASSDDELSSLVSGIECGGSSIACANSVLARAIERDGGRPRSDMAIAVVVRSKHNRSVRIDNASRTFQLRNHRAAL